MVRLEQNAVQKELADFKRTDAAGYGTAIKEINALLNGKSSASAEALGFLGRQLTSDGPYGKILAGVREKLGTINFENQKHREAIGLALVKHIRETGGCDVTDNKAHGCGR